MRESDVGRCGSGDLFAIDSAWMRPPIGVMEQWRVRACDDGLEGLRDEGEPSIFLSFNVFFTGGIKFVYASTSLSWWAEVGPR